MKTEREMLFDLVVQAVERDPAELPPTRPVRDYEDITIRQVSIDTVAGHHDITLYPEDIFKYDEDGDLDIRFLTIGNGRGWLLVRREHLVSMAYQESPHKRERGTLRPDPAKVSAEFQEAQRREKAERIAQRVRQEG